MTRAPDRVRFDLERIIPELMAEDLPLERETLLLHRERYRFAARFACGARVLDCACGVGYGSVMLAEAGATHVVGVDRASEAVAWAQDHYVRPNVEFVCADADSFAPAERFDLVVSLETIEHVPDATRLVRRLAALVAPGGVLVGSVPTTLSSDVNPYHLHDFSASGFRRLYADAGLVVLDAMTQRQPFSPLAILSQRLSSGGTQRDYGLRRGLARFYATHPGMLARRLVSTLRHGFCNKYLVLVGRPA